MHARYIEPTKACVNTIIDVADKPLDELALCIRKLLHTTSSSTLP
jgi:hypothetical protein